MPTKHKILGGGMMRCCIESVKQYFESIQDDPEPGTVIRCKWCKDGAEINDRHEIFKRWGENGCQEKADLEYGEFGRQEE